MYKIGDYGRFCFTLKSKGLITRFDLVAKVIEVEKNYLLLMDNDDIEYYPRIKDIDKFTTKID